MRAARLTCSAFAGQVEGRGAGCGQDVRGPQGQGRPSAARQRPRRVRGHVEPGRSTDCAAVERVGGKAAGESQDRGAGEAPAEGSAQGVWDHRTTGRGARKLAHVSDGRGRGGVCGRQADPRQGWAADPLRDGERPEGTAGPSRLPCRTLFPILWMDGVPILSMDGLAGSCNAVVQCCSEHRRACRCACLSAAAWSADGDPRLPGDRKRCRSARPRLSSGCSGAAPSAKPLPTARCVAAWGRAGLGLEGFEMIAER
eukprot:2312614-Rhodomonas_salina.3